MQHCTDAKFMHLQPRKEASEERKLLTGSLVKNIENIVGAALNIQVRQVT